MDNIYIISYDNIIETKVVSIEYVKDNESIYRNSTEVLNKLGICYMGANVLLYNANFKIKRYVYNWLK